MGFQQMLLARKSTLVRDSQPIWGVVPKDLHPCGPLYERDKASPGEIAASAPEDYLLGDKALYIAAVKNSKPTYSIDGMIS
jgi:hypothetical protein